MPTFRNGQKVACLCGYSFCPCEGTVEWATDNWVLVDIPVGKLLSAYGKSWSGNPRFTFNPRQISSDLALLGWDPFEQVLHYLKQAESSLQESLDRLTKMVEGHKNVLKKVQETQPQQEATGASSSGIAEATEGPLLPPKC